MKRKRFSEEQIISVLGEHEAGAQSGDLARKYGVSEATLYNWEVKYSGLDVSEKRLEGAGGREPEPEKPLAESMLHNATLKQLLYR